MKLTQKPKCLLVSTMLSTLALLVTTGYPMDDPWTWKTVSNVQTPLTITRGRSDSTPAIVGIQAIQFFQKYISPADGPRCNFYPSCSQYAKISLLEHGVIMGTILSFERFMRDHGWNQAGYPLIWVNDQPLYLDPVHANVYWWTNTQHNHGPANRKW